MKKNFAKWIPKCLNADQKLACVKTLLSICIRFRKDSEFLNIQNLPETQQQSMEWKHSCFPKPKKCRIKNLMEKILLQFLGYIWGRGKQQEENIIHNCLQNCVKIFRKTQTGDQNHITMTKIRDLGFHPPDLPDLVPSGCYICFKLKKRRNGANYGSCRKLNSRPAKIIFT